MKTIIINNGITLTASASTINTYRAERKAMEADKALREWLANPANWDAPEYSDIYKDVHGIRPY